MSMSLVCAYYIFQIKIWFTTFHMMSSSLADNWVDARKDARNKLVWERDLRRIRQAYHEARAEEQANRRAEIFAMPLVFTPVVLVPDPEDPVVFAADLSDLNKLRELHARDKRQALRNAAERKRNQRLFAR